ncbi:MAG: hypothetical protein K8R77_06635 [Anaerolineaceae bacterium]|nr:hypothetical protein [Anaerolineaceae bacterium]
MEKTLTSVNNNRGQAGQGTVEFALILVLVAVVVVASLSLMGPTIAKGFESVLNGLQLENTPEENKPLAIVGNFLSRINGFYAENGRWPRSWGSYAYTDIGLNPEDWDEPVEGIRWGPHGADVGLGTHPGDPYYIYVENQDGELQKLYDGWRIWCVAADGECYYHRVAPENKIDINTMVLVPR